LPPGELRQRLRDAIQELIDIEQWDRDITAEKVEFASIEQIAKLWQNLPKATGADTAQAGS
jgi:hypothetical protein